VIRLWHRIGVFRMLSVGLLVVGVVATGYLSVGRQSQHRAIKSSQAVVAAEDQPQAAGLLVDERREISAASRDAQREAKAKAEAEASAAAAAAKAAEEAAKKKQATTPTPGKSSAPPPPGKPGAPVGPVPASCNEYTGNVQIGCTLMLQAGFPISEMPCLKNLWMKESGWRTNARNPSGAGGIPQALPMNKMSKYGADYLTNPATQIRWGLDYIKGRYGKPCAAWGNWQSKGWY
jgi:Transglycosylase SLT domain